MAKQKVSKDALDLADIAASGAPLAADPEMIEAALQAMKGGGPSQDARDLADLAASGAPIAADPEMMDAGLKEARGYAEGGMVDDEESDPTDIPEDIREFIEKAHKEQQESRPDENWSIKSAETPKSLAPYTRDEEEVDADEEDESSVLGRLRSMNMPAMAKGGVVPGYDEGGMAPFDLDQGASATVKTNGQNINPMPDQSIPQDSIFNGAAEKAAMPAMDPLAAAAQSAQKMMPSAPAAAPIVPRGTLPGAKPAMPAAGPELTDQDFMNRANKLLGLGPDQQAGFLKLLGDNAQKGQIGAGIAGIGDAIASGGTLGKVNPGALHSAEEQIQGRTREGLEGMQTIRGNQKEAQELGDKLQARDPNSPLSKWAQKAYAGLGKKTGIDLSKASASMIADLAGKSVEALSAEGELALKTMGLDLQKQQVAATIANQKAERTMAKEQHQLEAGKTLADRGILKTIAGGIPFTAGNEATKMLERTAAGESPVPEGRISVVSPTGQVGHIPESQLKAAIAKGYKPQ